MVTCQIPGHASGYGLGIRIAFYLQWFGMIVTCWFLESDALNLKFLNGLTILATSIGLAVNLHVLQPVEIYVVLLLVCGTLYFMVPVYFWRLLTCCHPWWDTERWNRIRMGWLFRTGMALLFGTLLGIQIWFWCTGVYIRPPGTDTSCQQYGFLFGQIRLDSPSLTAINIILHIIMLVMGVWLFCDWIGMFDECRWWRRRKRRRWSITQDRIESLQRLRTILDLIAAAIVITAIELTISWNNIHNVNDLDTAAQLIPSTISAAYFLRSIYIWLSGPPPEDSHHHDFDFPYFPTGDGGGGSYSYTVTDGGGGSIPKRRRATVYFGANNEWLGGRRRHRRHGRHRRRSSQMDYDDTGEPVMSTAYSRRATVVDDVAPEGGPVAPEPVHENA